MNRIPAKTAAIHDLSGIGRCSLTVILPILSAMGVQACPIPTAVLSAHTGGFGDMAMRDLTDYIPSALEHYKSLNSRFDCVYSGYLASARQVDYCLDFFSANPAALKVADPVMGDNGAPYRMHTPELCKRMKELANAADIITPNITEAAMLLDENPLQPDLSSEKMKEFLLRLAEQGAGSVVITSVFGEGKHYNICYEKAIGKFSRVPYTHIDKCFPGTGDIFTSVLVGSILNGVALPSALSRAAAFLEAAISSTCALLPDNACLTETREGIIFENCLEQLFSDTGLYDYEEF